jgi:hypothetical protein
LRQVSVALLDPLAPPLGRLARLLLKSPVERIDVTTGEADPLASRAYEAVDFPIDVRLAVARVSTSTRIRVPYAGSRSPRWAVVVIDVPQALPPEVPIGDTTGTCHGLGAGGLME